MTRVSSTTLILLAVAAFGELRAEPGHPASFEVVSIKSNRSGQPANVVATALQLQPGGRFRALNVTLRQLVLLAYRSDITPAHLSGGPDWFDRDRFDVVAVAAPGTAPASVTGRARAQLLEEMIRTLLTDRFKLQVKRELRDADIYALVVAKGGPKLVPTKNPDCPATVEAATRCHSMAGGVARGLTGQGIDTDDIAAFLERAVLAPERVVNETRISGLFDVRVTWTPPLNGRPNPTGPNVDSPDPEGADVFTALQETLGLRLERRKAPVRFVTIEDAQRPSED